MYRIRGVVADRPVWVLLHGKSIQELENRIGQFRNHNICYASVNNFPIVEDNILAKINKRLDIIHCSSGYRVQQRIPMMEGFLARPDNNTMITQLNTLSSIEHYTGGTFVKRFREKVWLMQQDLKPGMSSIAYLLRILIEANTRQVILFGADGSTATAGDMKGMIRGYYHPEVFNNGTRTATDIVHDTIKLNSYMRTLMAAAKTHNTQVLNCSPDSTVKYIRKINYDDLQSNTMEG